MSRWLQRLGARLAGFALPPRSDQELFARAGLAAGMEHRLGDLREPGALRALLGERRPRLVFHLAAVSLLAEAREEPIRALEVNVLGTARLLEAIRAAADPRRPLAAVIVTTDKVYAPSPLARREDAPLGAGEPYAASKAAVELLVAAWRETYFPPSRLAEHGVLLATARAGNAVGPGDWAPHRLLPDLVRALEAGRPAGLRAPAARRPWQHVLDALSGYLWLGARLLEPGGERWARAWNFGPPPEEAWTAQEVAERFLRAWGGGSWEPRPGPPLSEATELRLDASAAREELGWRPVWSVADAVERAARGYRELARARSPGEVRALLDRELAAHEAAARAAGVPWA